MSLNPTEPSTAMAAGSRPPDGFAESVEGVLNRSSSTPLRAASDAGSTVIGGTGVESVVRQRRRDPSDERPVRLLLVNDDDVEVMAVERAFRRARIRSAMRVARDGHEALDILRGAGGRERMPGPYLILLDLHMPGMGGIELLQALRDDPELRKAVVFVFTSSRDEQHRVEAYRYNVAGYIIKSDMSCDFRRIAEMLHLYWNLVELP